MKTPTLTKAQASVSQAARQLGISLDATYRLIQAGKLAAEKDEDGYWMVDVRAIEARLKQRGKSRGTARR
jgi:excisionase family DNA binding protein